MRLPRKAKKQQKKSSEYKGELKFHTHEGMKTKSEIDRAHDDLMSYWVSCGSK